MKRTLSILLVLVLGSFGEICLAQELGRLFFSRGWYNSNRGSIGRGKPNGATAPIS